MERERERERAPPGGTVAMKIKSKTLGSISIRYKMYIDVLVLVMTRMTCNITSTRVIHGILCCLPLNCLLRRCGREPRFGTPKTILTAALTGLPDIRIQFAGEVRRG